MKVAHKQTDLSGFLPDQAPDTLKSGATSGGYNLKPTVRGWEKSEGYRETDITPTNEKRYILFWSPTQGDNRWYIGGATTIEEAEGNTITDVSRVGGYTAAGEKLWSGFDFNGVAIFNNTIDPPQYLAPGGAFADLPGIDNSYRFRELCKFKSYMVGLAPDTGQGFADDTVYWSHPADPGTVPANWDFADPASDSGMAPLPTSGFMITALELGDINIIYKSDSIWTMQFIGGQFIFKFLNKFPGQGVMNKRCVVDFESRHFVVTQNDFIVHDGYQLRSVAEKKVKEFFFQDLNAEYYGNVFLIKNPRTSEVMIFYPSEEGGTEYCDKCLVWSWRDNNWEIRKVPNMLHAAYGYEITGTTITWETYATSWERRGSWQTSEDLRQFAPVIHYSSQDFAKILAPSSSGLLVNDDIESVWEREDIIVGSISRDGVPYQDYDRQKVITQLDFDMDSTEPFELWIGTKDDLNDEPVWELIGEVDPEIDKRVHLLVTTSFLSIRLVSTAAYFTLRRIGITYEFAGEIW